MNHHEYSHSYPISLRVEPPFITISLGRSQGHLPHGPWPWKWPFCFPGCGYPAWVVVIVGPSGLFGSKYLKGISTVTDNHLDQICDSIQPDEFFLFCFPLFEHFGIPQGLIFQRNCPLRCPWVSMPKVAESQKPVGLFFLWFTSQNANKHWMSQRSEKAKSTGKPCFFPIIITMFEL